MRFPQWKRPSSTVIIYHNRYLKVLIATLGPAQRPFHGPFSERGLIFPFLNNGFHIYDQLNTLAGSEDHFISERPEEISRLVYRRDWSIYWNQRTVPKRSVSFSRSNPPQSEHRLFINDARQRPSDGPWLDLPLSPILALMAGSTQIDEQINGPVLFAMPCAAFRAIKTDMKIRFRRRGLFSLITYTLFYFAIRSGAPSSTLLEAINSMPGI